MTKADRALEAVLLDLDGTLIASRDGIVSCLRAAMRDLDEADPGSDLDWVIGPPLPDIMARLLGERGHADLIQAAVEAYRRHYDTSGMLESKLFPGVAHFMDQLAASGRRVFLATSKPVHLARKILELRGLTSYFHGFYGARPDDSGAEKPELIANLVAQEKILTHRAVMVGDRRYDISGAHANGIRGIGALWGYGGLDELEEAGADALAESPHTLFEIVEEQLAAASLHA